MPKSTPIEIAFCRAELDSPTCVIPNGHLIRVIGGAEAPIAVVSPGAGTHSRRRMIAYAHTFAAAPRMLGALKMAVEILDSKFNFTIEPGSKVHQVMKDALEAAQPRK